MSISICIVWYNHVLGNNAFNEYERIIISYSAKMR